MPSAKKSKKKTSSSGTNLSTLLDAANNLELLRTEQEQVQAPEDAQPWQAPEGRRGRSRGIQREGTPSPVPAEEEDEVEEVPELEEDEEDTMSEELQAHLASLKLSTLEEPLITLEVFTLEDLSFYSTDALRKELHAIGFKAPLHVVAKLVGKKPAAGMRTPGMAPPPPSHAAPTSDIADLIGAVTGAGTTTAAPSSDPVALVTALLRGLSTTDRPSVIAQCLALVGGIRQTGFDAATCAQMDEEQLQGALLQRGATLDTFADASFDVSSPRTVRVLFAAKLRSLHAPQMEPHADLPTNTESPNNSTLAQLLQETMSGTTSGRNVSLGDEAAASRIAAVARKPAAAALLKRLDEAVIAGSTKQLAEMATAAQRMHPELAALLHTENLRMPEAGAVGLGGSGSMRPVPLAEARELAKWAMHVIEVAPGAIAKHLVAPSLPSRLGLGGSLESLCKAAWTWKLVAAPSSGGFELKSLLDEQAPKVLMAVSGKKGGDADHSFYLVVWPAVCKAMQHCHPADSTVDDTLERVGSLAKGDMSEVSIAEGQAEVVAPFLTNLASKGKSFQRGGAYVDAAAVWRETSEEPTVTAWLGNTNLRSKHASEIAKIWDRMSEYDTSLKAQKKLVDDQQRLIASLEKKLSQKKEPPLHQPREPNARRTDPELEGLTGAARTAKRNEIHQRKVAAAEAASAGAPSAADAAAGAPAGQRTQPRRITHPPAEQQ
jgi:hypothetical protein